MQAAAFGRKGREDSTGGTDRYAAAREAVIAQHHRAAIEAPRQPAADEAPAPIITYAMAEPTRYHGAGSYDFPAVSENSGRIRAMLHAYMLWFFLGWVSGHRVFLKSPLSATIQAVMLWLGIALLFQNPANRNGAVFLIAGHVLWWLSDVLLIPDLVRSRLDADGETGAA